MQDDCAYSLNLLYSKAMVTQKNKKQIAKRKPRSRNTTVATINERVFESDSTYFLKLVVFVLLGTLWLKFAQPISWMGIPMAGIPLGMLVGLVLVSRFEKHQSDRKIWYAILLVITIICYFVPAGIVI